MPAWYAVKVPIRSITDPNLPSQDLFAPSVSIPLLDGNQTLSGNFNFRANFADNVAVIKGEFLIDGKLVHTWTSAPYDFTYDTSKLYDGQHLGVMKAYDVEGNGGFRNVSFKTSNGSTVPADTKPPTVAITVPKAGDSIPKGAIIRVTAEARDNETAISRVEITVGNVKRATLISAPYIWTWDTSTFEKRPTAMYARAYDAAGNVALSTTITVNVTAAPSMLGDANNDGRVNIVDFVIVESHYGEAYTPADFDADGRVTIADQAIVQSNWTW